MFTKVTLDEVSPSNDRNLPRKLLATISGRVVSDLDDDGRADLGRADHPGIRVFIDANRNGQHDANEPFSDAGNRIFVCQFTHPPAFTV